MIVTFVYTQMMSCLVGPLSQERIGGLHPGSCHLPVKSVEVESQSSIAHPTGLTSASFCSFSPVFAGEAAEAAEVADFVSALAAASTAGALGALGALGGSAVDLAKGQCVSGFVATHSAWKCFFECSSGLLHLAAFCSCCPVNHLAGAQCRSLGIRLLSCAISKSLKALDFSSTYVRLSIQCLWPRACAFYLYFSAVFAMYWQACNTPCALSLHT